MRRIQDLTVVMDKHWAEMDRLDKAIERLKAKREKAVKLNWIDQVVKPIAKSLQRILPGHRTVDVMGPFGICSEVNILFIKRGVTEGDMWKKPGNVKSITFVPHISSESPFSIAVVDPTKNDKSFLEGSIGALNGMNHPRIPVDPKWTARDLLKYVR
jgi:hypothetical protein